MILPIAFGDECELRLGADFQIDVRVRLLPADYCQLELSFDVW